MNRRPLILLLLPALVLTGCPRSFRGRPAIPTEEPRRGGVLRVALAEDVDYLDPQRAGQPAALAVMRATHRGLMAFSPEAGDRGRTPVPDLADGPPEVSADGRTYTFTLRQGAAFDAPAPRPVRAADVVAGLQRLLAPGSGSPYATYFRVIEGADAFAARRAPSVAGVTAPDERTVVVRLARPVNDLLWILALPAASAVPAELAGVARPSLAALSASGPYRLAPKDGYVPESGIHLVRNPAWTRDADPVRPAYVDEIRVTIPSGESEVRARLLDGSADLSLDTPPDPATLANYPSLLPRTVTVRAGCLRYLWMNTSVPPLNSLALRRSIAAAIDRAGILRAHSGPLAGEQTAWPIPSAIIGADPAAQPSVYGSPVRQAGAARGPLRLVVGDRAVDVAEGRAVQASLAKIGVAVTVATMPIASLYVDGYEIPARRIPMGIATWCADWPGLGGRGQLGALLGGGRISGGGNQNYSMLNDRNVVRLLDAAASAPGASASDAWRRAAAAVVQLAPWAPLLDVNEVSLVSARVGGLAATPMFPRGDLAAVWLRG